MTMTDDDQGRSAEQAAVDQLVEAGLLDELMSRVDAGELQLTGEGGFLPGLIKAVLKRGLAAELTDHLGYEKGDPGGEVHRTLGTVRRPRRSRPRSVMSVWTRLGIGTGPSSRGWCPRGCAGLGGSTR